MTSDPVACVEQQQNSEVDLKTIAKATAQELLAKPTETTNNETATVTDENVTDVAMEEADASESSIETTKSTLPPTEEDVQAAKDLFAESKKLHIKGEFTAVADNLSKVLEVFTAHFGELNQECASVYYYYGDALLQVAKAEQTVLGDGVEGEDDDESADKEVEEEEEGDSEELVAESKAAEPAAEAEPQAEVTEKEEEAKDADFIVPVDEDKEAVVVDDAPEHEGSNTDTFQLSWEVLETARLIYSGIPALHVELAQVYSKLAEHASELGLHERAIEDYNSCLKIRKENLPEDDRSIAETHYWLGLICETSKKFQESKDSFANAIQVLKLRSDNLNAKLTTINADNATEAEDIKKEIEEIGSLIPDIEEKITSVVEWEAAELQKQKEEEEEDANTKDLFTAALGCTSSDINDLTESIRRKRGEGVNEEQSSSSDVTCSDETAAADKELGTEKRAADNVEAIEDKGDGKKRKVEA